MELPDEGATFYLSVQICARLRSIDLTKLEPSQPLRRVACLMRRCTMQASMLEVYNEDIRDLLGKGPPAGNIHSYISLGRHLLLIKITSLRPCQICHLFGDAFQSSHSHSAAGNYKSHLSGWQGKLSIAEQGDGLPWTLAEDQLHAPALGKCTCVASSTPAGVGVMTVAMADSLALRRQEACSVA